MPKLPPIQSVNYPEPELIVNNETKPSEIIQQIVRAAKRRWSSPLLLDSLSSLSTTTTDQQTSKPINISVKRYEQFSFSFSSMKNKQKFFQCGSSELKMNLVS